MDFGEVLVAMTGIIIGGTIVILPILALTLRFVLRPMLESWARARLPAAAEERIETTERRVAILEEHIRLLERQNAKLMEDADFLLKLRNP